MSSEHGIEFTKDNIDTYLKEVAKEYRRLVGKAMPAELILIGGASVLINYGFRDMTIDIDAVIQAGSSMKDAINRVRDRYNLPVGWLNSDFQKTASYSPRLVEHAQYYREYSNVLTIRTISAEYLIAMKLRSGRQYKNDLSDILGILADHQRRGMPIAMAQIHKAVVDLYDDWESLPEASRTFIERVMSDGRFTDLYDRTKSGEREAQNMLIQFEHDYPGATNESNVNEIISSLRTRQTSKASIREKLKEKQIAAKDAPRNKPGIERKTPHR